MKNKLYMTLTLLCLGVTTIAQVGIGTDTPNDAAILEIQSTDKGILLPRLELSKISSLDNVQGLMVYCTDCDGNKGVLKINNGSEWVDYVPSSGGSFSGEVSIGETEDLSSPLTVGESSENGNNVNIELYSESAEKGSQLKMKNQYGYAFVGLSSDERANLIVHNSSSINSPPYYDKAGVHFSTNNILRMVITREGNVGIGRINPQDRLDVSGNIRGENFINTSDQRWKKEIKTLNNSLNKITSLRGVSYQWKRDEFPDKNFSEGTQIGVIAQEVETVFPELVHTDTERL